MPVWKVAFLVLLVAVPGFAMVEEASDASDQHIEEADGEPQEDGDAPGEATPEQLHRLHVKMDADANGKLSLDELLHFFRESRRSSDIKIAEDSLLRMDGDKDGKLSLDEILKAFHHGLEQSSEDDDFRKKLKARDGEKFKAADKDSDGFLDEKEFLSFSSPDVDENVLQIVAQHSMEDQDEDKDGFLTIDEFWGKVEEGDERSVDDLAMFNQVDKDQNGKIDMKELLAWESGHIGMGDEIQYFMNLADTDDDKHVTIDELHAVHGKEDNPRKYDFEAMVHQLEL